MVSIFLLKNENEEVKLLGFGEGIKIIQEQYPGYVILAKNGIFYNAIGEDAILLNQEFGLTKIC